MAKTLPTAIGLLLLLLFIAFFGLTGCEKIVEVEKTIYDTVTVHDTTEVPKGPAYVRFVSMLPDRTAGVALSLSSGSNSEPFALAGDRSRNEFIPVKAREGLRLYATYYRGSTKLTDSILLPPFEPTQLYTCAIFGIEDIENGTMTLEPHFSWDSLKTVPASQGKAYLRLLNGLADFPVPSPEVNVKLKSVSDSVLFPVDVKYREIANYVEIPVGAYQVYLTAPGESGSILNTATINANQGSYYSAMVFGRKSDGTAKFQVLGE